MHRAAPILVCRRTLDHQEAILTRAPDKPSNQSVATFTTRLRHAAMQQMPPPGLRYGGWEEKGLPTFPQIFSPPIPQGRGPPPAKTAPTNPPKKTTDPPMPC